MDVCKRREGGGGRGPHYYISRKKGEHCLISEEGRGESALRRGREQPSWGRGAAK